MPLEPPVPSLRSSHDGVAHRVASLALQTPCVGGAVGPFAALVTRQRRSLRRPSRVANDVCLWRRRSLRFARHMSASLIASLLLRCKQCVPVVPSVPAPRSSHEGVAYCFASLALQTACACGAVGPFASLVTQRRRSLLRFSRVANGVCLWRRRSRWLTRRTMASLVASLLLRRKRPVPVAPSVPSLRSLHHGVACCFASLALQWRRRSLRLARHTTAPLIASLLLRCGAPSVPLLRSSHDGVAHCFASLALQTVCACGAAVLMLAIPERTVTPPHADGQSSSDFISNAMTAVMES